MLCRIALAYNRMSQIGEAASVVEVALDERLVALSEPIDVFPRLSVAERQLVRSGSYDRA